MSSPRWTKIRRDIWLHKTRTILALLAIVIGLVGAGIVLDAWSLVRRVVSEQYAASHPPAMTLRVDSVDRALLEMVRQLPSVSAARRRRTAPISIRAANGTATGSLVVLDDFTDSRIGVLKLEAGHWASDDSSIVVEHSSLDFAGTSLGASLDIRSGDGAPTRFRVVGVARDVGIPPGWMDHDVTLFGSRAALSSLGLDSSFTQLQATLRDATNDLGARRRASRDIASAVERAGYRVEKIDVSLGRHPHAAQMDSLLLTQGAFGILATLLSAFLVVNLIGAMLAGQIREIGIMKSVGGRREQIATLYLAFAASLGVVAASIALPTAAAIGRLYAQFSAQLLNFGITGVAIPWWSLAAQLLTALLLPVAAASIPVIRACSMTVASALRGSTNDDSSAAQRIQRWMSFTWLPRPATLALRMVARRPLRSAMAMLIVAAGGALFLGARSLRRGVVASVDRLYANYRFDFSLRFDAPHGIDSLEAAVRGVQGVRNAEAWMPVTGQVAFADGSVGSTFTIMGVPTDTRLLRPSLLAGRWLAPGDDRALVVSARTMADEPSIAVGSPVTIRINGQTQEWTVVGIAEMGFDAGAFAAREVVMRASARDRVSSVVVDVGDTTTLGRIEAIRRARETLGPSGFAVKSGQVVDAGRDAIEDHLVMVVSFLGAMAQVMVLVGGLGLMSTMSISVIERTREIGVLRAIGATPAIVQLLVHVESLFIVLVASFGAVVLSMPIGRVLGVVFGRIMLPVDVDLVPDGRSVLQWLAIVVVVSMVAAFIPARRASRVQIREALGYE